MVEVRESIGESGAAASVRAQLLLASAIIWTVNFGILTTRSVMSDPGGWPEALPVRLVLTGLCLVLCYAMHLAFSRFRTSTGRQLLLALVLVPVATEAYAWTSVLVARAAFGMGPQPFTGDTVVQLGFSLWVFSSWTGLYLAITYGHRLREEERQVQASRLLAKTAQLQALRYQINPHFLFNTLNSISALIEDDRKEDAERMVEGLSRFLRTTLETEGDEEIPLSDELELQRAYLEVEQIRFPDLALAIDVDPETEDALVPHLILQPLVENAVKHGVARRSGRSSISISADQSHGKLRLRVRNDTATLRLGQGRPDGIGLANVRERLAARHGAAAELRTSHPAEDAFEVEVLLPMKAAA